MISNQQMSVQGLLARTVLDARAAFEVMAVGDPRDPGWNPVPLALPRRDGPLRVAVLREPPTGSVHLSVLRRSIKRQLGCPVRDA